MNTSFEDTKDEMQENLETTVEVIENTAAEVSNTAAEISNSAAENTDASRAEEVASVAVECSTTEADATLDEVSDTEQTPADSSEVAQKDTKKSRKKKVTFGKILKWIAYFVFSPIILVWLIIRTLWRGWCGLLHLLGFKRLDSYILKKFLTTYAFLIIVVIAVVLIVDFNEKIDKITGSGAMWDEILLDYYANFVPYFANMFSPLFTFIAVIFFTTNLASHSEIIAMKSTGMSFRRLLVPYMMGAMFIAAFSFGLGGWVIPQGNVHKNAFENKYIKKRKVIDFAENVQMQVDTGVIAYISTFDNRTKTGSGFLLSKYSEKDLISHLEAETIQYDTLAENKYSWTVRNYRIRTVKGTREEITQGDRLDTMLIMEPKDFFYTFGQQETMTITELDEFIDRQRLRGSAGLATFEVEYHKRMAAPFAAFILTLIGVSLSCEKRKGGMGTSIGIGLALTFGYILFQTISSSFAINGGWPPALAVWTPNILYFFIAAWFYFRTPN